MKNKNLNPDKAAKIQEAHARAISMNATMWKDWMLPVDPPKRKRVKTSRTGRYKVAQSFKAGSGKYS